MLNFRYHALSLTAVFFALAVGLLLGVAIGDSGLVSSADRQLRDSLHKDVNRADERLRSTQAQLTQAQQFQTAILPLVVSGQLNGRSVGVVFLGQRQQDIADDVKAALQDTGATVRYTAAIGTPPDLGEAGRLAAGTRYADLAAVPEPDLGLVGAFAFRIGAQAVNPGQLLRSERSTIFDTFNGDLQPVDAVVVVYDPSTTVAAGYASDARNRFDQSFVDGLRKAQVPVVGIEQSSTDPSRVSWYKSREISSVDDVEETAGRASLVFALQGSQGAFGRKDSASDGLLPDIVRAHKP